MLGIGPGLLRQWRNAGQGPAAYVFGPHLTRYRRSDIEAFIESMRAS